MFFPTTPVPSTADPHFLPFRSLFPVIALQNPRNTARRGGLSRFPIGYPNGDPLKEGLTMTYDPRTGVSTERDREVIVTPSGTNYGGIALAAVLVVLAIFFAVWLFGSDDGTTAHHYRSRQSGGDDGTGRNHRSGRDHRTRPRPPLRSTTTTTPAN